MARTVQLDARVLLRRVERCDREAAYDLARILRPDSVTELVGYVRPDSQITTPLFDVLADAFADYRAYPG